MPARSVNRCEGENPRSRRCPRRSGLPDPKPRRVAACPGVAEQCADGVSGGDAPPDAGEAEPEVYCEHPGKQGREDDVLQDRDGQGPCPKPRPLEERRREEAEPDHRVDEAHDPEIRRQFRRDLRCREERGDPGGQYERGRGKPDADAGPEPDGEMEGRLHPGIRPRAVGGAGDRDNRRCYGKYRG